MMRRPYRNETYLDLCSRMKQARPDLSITTDIIVGFPGETEEDYLLTRQAVEQVQFDNAFISAIPRAAARPPPLWRIRFRRK